MKPNNLPHLENTDWQKKRTEDWFYLSNNHITKQAGYSKNAIQAFKDLFFNGTLGNILNDETVGPYEITRYYPANTLDDIKYITKQTWEFFINNDSKGRYSRKKGISTSKDWRFFENFISLSFQSLDHVYINHDLMNPVFFWVFGEKYEPIRKINIGLEDWLPTFEVDVTVLAFKLINRLSSYLIDENGMNEYPYIVNRIDYLFSIIPYLSETLLSTSLTKKNQNKVENFQQLFMRKFFLYILGFKTRSEKVNDPETVLKIKTWALDSNNGMSEEFHEFIKYLQENKRSTLKK